MTPRQKKLIFKSQHMGTKENDLILGSYAKAYIAQFSDTELNLYEQFLSENDVQITRWLMMLEDFPDPYQSWLGPSLLKHCQKLSKATDRL